MSRGTNSSPIAPSSPSFPTTSDHSPRDRSFGDPSSSNGPSCSNELPSQDYAPTPETPTNKIPTAAAISARAHEIWEAEGCPEGHELEHWLKAEKQLREERPSPAQDEDYLGGTGPAL